jgi:hypothetical protein
LTGNGAERDAEVAAIGRDLGATLTPWKLG